MDAPRLDRRPEARPISVEQVLQWVQAGQLRVPRFQRRLRWQNRHVIEFLDSIYRGYPVGTLLLSKRDAPDGKLSFGILEISAQERSDALYIVDGQQRVTALACTCLHPKSTPHGDMYAVWFDLENETFHRNERRDAPDTWIPLNVVVDSERLLDWLDDWVLKKERRDLRQRAIALGKAVREYQIPAYVIETGSEDTLRRIFKRTNTSGVAMQEDEVFDALYGTDKTRPVEDACHYLAELGFGAFDTRYFWRCLQTVSGLSSHSKDLEKDVEPRAALRTRDALERVIEFLRTDARIPHLSLLPYRLPITVLARFFHTHPEPSPRTRLLLVRWVWRGALSQAHSKSSDAMVSKLTQCITEVETNAVGSLLETVTAKPVEGLTSTETWSARSAITRLFALVLLQQYPVEMGQRKPISIEATLQAEAHWTALFQPPNPTKDTPIAAYLAIGPGKNARERLTAYLNKADLQKPLQAHSDLALFLTSHVLTQEMAKALKMKDDSQFAELRSQELDRLANVVFRERAGWGENDRPAIRDLMNQLRATLPA